MLQMPNRVISVGLFIFISLLNTSCFQPSATSFDRKLSPTIVGTVSPPPFDNDIHLIQTSPVKADADGGYTFIVFGDTRTAEDDSKEEHKAFHIARNMTHSAVTEELEGNKASFALYTGDLIWRGSNTKYWQEIRQQFPADLRSTSSPRIFPVLGNHELWQQDGEDDAMRNYFETFPYLTQNGVQFYNYAFVIGSSLFVNLCSGQYGDDKATWDEDDRTWNCKATESFDKLMQSLKLLYVQQADRGRKVKNIFMTYHKPSYSSDEHPPLRASNDPLGTLLAFKNDNPDLKIVIFNGHNHVTELFKPSSGVLALVAGGGGAPQKLNIPVNDHGKPMEELFWKAVDGNGRYRRINYFRIHVANDESVSLEERVLCSDNDAVGSEFGYFQGLSIAPDGTISNGGLRNHDCDLDQYRKRLGPL